MPWSQGEAKHPEVGTLRQKAEDIEFHQIRVCVCADVLVSCLLHVSSRYALSLSLLVHAKNAYFSQHHLTQSHKFGETCLVS